MVKLTYVGNVARRISKFSFRSMSQIASSSLSKGALPDDLYCTEIEKAVHEELKKANIDQNSGLLLSVSGGSDSVALLHILQRIKERWWPQLNLKIVNYNHKQRPESDEEVKLQLNYFPFRSL